MRPLLACLLLANASAAELSVSSYPSIQAALDANPNRMIFVPAGDFPITEKIRVRGERSGLFGPGRIIQQSTDQPIIEIENTTSAEIRDLTLTRPEGKMESRNEGILAIKCRDLVIDNVRVIDNRSPAGAITLRESRDCRISRCLVRNYMRVSVDDRTQSADWGYAFNCTDGTGISVSYSSGTLIEGNRVIEDNFVPTPEVKAKYKLGDFVKKNAVKGGIKIQLIKGLAEHRLADVIAGQFAAARGAIDGGDLITGVQKGFSIPAGAATQIEDVGLDWQQL